MNLLINDIYEVMNFDPLTLKWKDKILTEQQPKTLRATIQGNMDGYPTTVYLYDEDLIVCDEDGRIIGISDIEQGVFQHLEGQMQDHGILAPFRSKSVEAGSPEPDNSGPWKCPVHGNQDIRPAYKAAGTQCSAWADGNGSPPDWANSTTPRLVQGKPRWYCKYKEFAN